MNQALLVYRFATAFQGAIRIMLKRSCVAVLAATAVGLLFCAGAARGETPLAGGNKGVNGILDGGHLLYYSAEAISGRPLAQKVQEYGLRFGFGFRQRGQQQRSQNGDDGDDDQQFNQGECAMRHPPLS